MDTKYSDTKKGVIAMLADVSDIPRAVLERAKIYPDNWAEGVWHLEWSKPIEEEDGLVECIAYLAGYPEPGGRVREHNDFECGYDDYDMTNEFEAMYS